MGQQKTLGPYACLHCNTMNVDSHYSNSVLYRKDVMDFTGKFA